MIGKRRFIVIVLSLGVVLSTELLKPSGLSATGVTAMSFIVGTYFGFDMGSKLKNGNS